MPGMTRLRDTVDPMGLAAAAALTALFIYPVINGFTDLLLHDPLGAISDVLARGYVSRSLWFTLSQAFVSSLLATLVGGAAGFLLAIEEYPGGRLLRSLSIVPFMAPPIVVVAGFTGLYGERGLLSLLLGHTILPYGYWAVVAAHVYYNIPLGMMLIYSAVAGAPREELDLIRIYAGSTWGYYRLLLRVLARYVAPAAATAFTLSYIYCFTSFTIPLVLGGGYGYYTLEVFIYVYYKTLLRPRLAEAVALLQALILITIASVYIIVSRRAPLPRPGTRHRIGLPRPARAAGAVFLLVVAAYLYAPLLTIPYYAVTDPYRGWVGLEGFRLVFSTEYDPRLMMEPVKAIYNSVYFAAMTALFSISLALIIGLSRRFALELAALAPLTVSPLTLALGLVRTYWGVLSDWQLIIMAHTMAALPLASRSIVLGLSRLRGVFTETAYVHGVRGLDYVFLVALPAMAPAFTAALAFSLAASLGEFGATLFIHEPSSTTLGILVYKLRGYRLYPASYAAAAILLAMTGVLLYLAARRSERWL